MYHVLDGFTDNDTYVQVYKDITEGGRFPPLLWALYITDLVHCIQSDQPHLTIPHPYVMTLLSILLYVDDFCLITHTPSSIQSLVNTA
jgi:hypothetical protein